MTCEETAHINGALAIASAITEKVRHMFYVCTMTGENTKNEDIKTRCHSLAAAMAEAENFKKKTGKEYKIIELKMVWTTQTLEDALRAH